MKNAIVKARVNDKFDFENLNELDLNAVKTGPNTFHILDNAKAFHAEILGHDFETKTYQIRINGSTYEVKLSDEMDQLVKELGFSANVVKKVKDIKAPMPGLVLDIMVKEGDVIEEGQPLLILEAMKMENVIKSPGEGAVKNINVTKSEAIEKGQLLIELD